MVIQAKVISVMVAFMLAGTIELCGDDMIVRE